MWNHCNGNAVRAALFLSVSDLSQGLWHTLFARRTSDSARRVIAGALPSRLHRTRRPSSQPRPGGRCPTWKASRPHPTTTRALCLQSPRSDSMQAQLIVVLTCSMRSHASFLRHGDRLPQFARRRSHTENLNPMLTLCCRASQVRVRPGPRHRPVKLPAHLRRLAAVRHLQPGPQHLRQLIAAVHLARQ